MEVINLKGEAMWCEAGVSWEMLRFLETEDRSADPLVESLTEQAGRVFLCLGTT